MRKISQLVALLVLVSFAWTQTTGKIRGTVSSSDGQALAGANVIVDGTSKGAATDADGKFTILSVEAGTYSVTVSYIGYQSNTQSNVSVKVGLTTPINFSMQASSVEGEAVTIVGERRLIEASATNSVRVIGDQEIRNSASRSVAGMVDMQPGVNITNGRSSVRGSRAEEVAYTLDGAAITDVINTGFEFSAIPEALAEISVEAGGYGAHVGGANSGVIRQVLKTGSNEVGGDVRFETGDYGLTDLTATVSVPVGPVKTFIAITQNKVDDWDPTYYTDFEINNGEAMPSAVSGVTPDGESVAVKFDSGGENGVPHRGRETLKINGTASVDFGPLNLRFSSVIDNVKYEFNGSPIYHMFNNDRLGEAERNLSLFNGRANYFLNPDLMLSAGFFSMSRNYEYYDGAFGSGDFEKAIGYYDSTSVADQGVDASWWAGGNTNFANGQTYSSPQDYFVAGTFAFARPGDVTTGWGMNQRNSVGFDAGLVWQRGDHEIRAGFDYKKYTYRSYNLSTGAMYNIQKNIFDEKYSKQDVVSETTAQVTADLAAFNRGGQIGYDDYGNEIDDDWTGPREPTVTSFYFNDKFETGEIVVNAGVRVDIFMMDDWRMKDPANPGWDSNN